MEIRKKLLSINKVMVKIFSSCGINRIYPAKVAYRRFIIPLLKTDFAEVDGHKMFLDSKDSLHLSVREAYEPLETELIKKEIKKGDTVLDIGANIGYYTLIFARLVGENGKVFAFEPDPTNFSLLKKNVEINGYKNVILIQKAVSNKSERLKLYLSKDNMGGHTICNPHNSRQSVEVEAIRLDDYFENYNGKIDFIKMDIEGAEGGAIQGMSNILKNNNVKIVSEFCPGGLKRFGIDSEEYLKLLIKFGFKLYEVSEREKKIKSVDIPKPVSYTHLTLPTIYSV